MCGDKHTLRKRMYNCGQRKISLQVDAEMGAEGIVRLFIRTGNSTD